MSAKSKTFMFSTIRFGLDDFGIVIEPVSMAHRIATWADGEHFKVSLEYIFLYFKLKGQHIYIYIYITWAGVL